ncbi:amidohydrolase, partial [Escherichia coli]
MPGLKITLLQQPLVWMDGPANLRHFDRQLEGITGRDVIVLPEMFTSGFAMEAAASSLAQDDVVNWMTAKAQQCNALIAGSVALQTESGSVNRFLLVEPGGTVHFYDKRHLFRMADEHLHYKAGNARVIVEWRGWRILPLVCYDLRFPVWSCVFRSIRSRIGIEVRSAIRIYSINRELNFFYRFLTRFFAAFH